MYEGDKKRGLVTRLRGSPTFNSQVEEEELATETEKEESKKQEEIKEIRCLWENVLRKDWSTRSNPAERSNTMKTEKSPLDLLKCSH